MRNGHPWGQSELGVPSFSWCVECAPVSRAGRDACLLLLPGRLIRMAIGWFYLSSYALSLLGVMCIILTVYWMQLWHGGFAWDGSILMFNYHPVFMVAGSVVIYSAGECAVLGGVL